MPVFRVEKVKDYTIMPCRNTHLRNRQLSLRAKGLLCQMLALPPEWNFTLQGLAYINKEGLDAITAIIHELEQAGYITRDRICDEKGLLREMEYTVYSSSKLNDSFGNNPITENPHRIIQHWIFQRRENQCNKVYIYKILKNKLQNDKLSIPSLSVF